MTTTISGTAGISPSGLQSIVGQVSHFAMFTPPPGWVECNGAAVSRTTYSKLFSVIGTLYGAGDGSTTFNLPELRGEFIRGMDAGRGVDTNRVLGSLQLDDLKSHSHSIWGDVNGGVGGWGRIPTCSQGGLEAWVSTEAAGGSETRPRNVALLACIFTGV